MTATKLSKDVTRFIQASVPTIDALQILLFLVGRRGMPCTLGEVLETLGGRTVAEQDVRQYLDLLRSQGVVAESSGVGYFYHPSSAEIEKAIGSLVEAYNQRPVTLIRTVYGIADSANI